MTKIVTTIEAIRAGDPYPRAPMIDYPHSDRAHSTGSTHVDDQYTLESAS